MHLNFTRAFETAWERMMIILFRPFDLGKWFVIGFCAFLAGLIGGGNGVNSSFRVPNFPTKGQGTLTYTPPSAQEQMNQLHDKISHLFAGAAFGMVMAIIVVVFLFVIALTLVMFWLGARGQFMFLDNIVRNRAAVAVPWILYARQGNSFFLVYLALAFATFALLLPLIVVGVIIAWPLFQQNRLPVGGEIVGLVVTGLIYLAVSIVLTIVLFLFREFGIPIMFRQGILARDAFFATMKLAMAYPGSVAVFILLRMAIFIGVAVLGVIICCFTLCCGMLPYIGTVFLLPALVFVRCFTLDCLAQFGMEYDAFMVDAAPVYVGQGIPPNHLPPPG